jgi:hypothetical protein
MTGEPHDCSSLVIVELLIIRAACERVDLLKTHWMGSLLKNYIPESSLVL